MSPELPRSVSELKTFLKTQLKKVAPKHNRFQQYVMQSTQLGAGAASGQQKVPCFGSVQLVSSSTTPANLFVFMRGGFLDIYHTVPLL